MERAQQIPEHLQEQQPVKPNIFAYGDKNERKLYFSSLSLQMHKAQHDEIVGSRVGQFSDLHKLLAEKDLRIQELLMELRSYKDQTGSYIEELQETITHLEQNNRELESTIKELRSELSFNKILIAEKNQFIQELMTKNNGPICFSEKLQDSSVYESFVQEHRAVAGNKLLEESVDLFGAKRLDRSLQMENNSGNKQINQQNKQMNKDNQSQKGQQNEDAKIRKSMRLSNPIVQQSFDERSLVSGIDRDRLRTLEEKEQLLIFFAENISPEICSSEEEILELLRQPMELIVSAFIQEFRALKAENKGLKQLNESQSISIIDLEKVVEQQILDRRSILEEKNQLKQQLEAFSSGINHSQVNEMKEIMIKSDHERRALELELFKMRMQIQESKNTGLDIKEVAQSICLEERSNIQNSPSTILQRCESEEQSGQKSVVCHTDPKVDEFNLLLRKKDEKLGQMSSKYKQWSQKWTKLVSLADDINNSFSPIVNNNFGKRKQVYDRIDRKLRQRLSQIDFGGSPISCDSKINGQGLENVENIEPSFAESQTF